MTGATIALASEDDPLIDLSEMLVDEAMTLHGINWVFVPPKPAKRRKREATARQKEALHQIRLSRTPDRKDEWSALEPSEL